MTSRSNPEPPAKPASPPSPEHPGDDSPMPPYSPGGVPPVDTDEKANKGDRTRSTWPPKRTP